MIRPLSSSCPLAERHLGLCRYLGPQTACRKGQFTNHTVDGQSPFRTTLKPWLQPCLLVFARKSSFHGFLGGEKWISSIHSMFGARAHVWWYVEVRVNCLCLPCACANANPKQDVLGALISFLGAGVPARQTGRLLGRPCCNRKARTVLAT